MFDSDFKAGRYAILNSLTLKLPEVINMKLLSIISIQIQQTGNENVQTYQVKAAILIWR